MDAVAWQSSGNHADQVIFTWGTNANNLLTSYAQSMNGNIRPLLNCVQFVAIQVRHDGLQLSGPVWGDDVPAGYPVFMCRLGPALRSSK